MVGQGTPASARVAPACVARTLHSRLLTGTDGLCYRDSIVMEQRFDVRIASPALAAQAVSDVACAFTGYWWWSTSEEAAVS